MWHPHPHYKVNEIKSLFQLIPVGIIFPIKSSTEDATSASEWYIVQSMICTISDISDVVLSDIKVKILVKKPCLCWDLQSIKTWKRWGVRHHSLSHNLDCSTVDICVVFLCTWHLNSRQGRLSTIYVLSRYLTCSLIVSASVQSKQDRAWLQS